MNWKAFSIEKCAGNKRDVLTLTSPSHDFNLFLFKLLISGLLPSRPNLGDSWHLAFTYPKILQNLWWLRVERTAPVRQEMQVSSLSRVRPPWRRLRTSQYSCLENIVTEEPPGSNPWPQKSRTPLSN